MDIDEIKRTIYGLDLNLRGTEAILKQRAAIVAKGGNVNISFDQKQQRYITTFVGPLEGVPSDKHFGKTLKKSRFVTLDMQCHEWTATAQSASFSYSVNPNLDRTIITNPDVITLTRPNPTAGRRPRMEATTHRITDFLWDHVTRQETPFGPSGARDHVEFALDNARCDIRQRKDLPYATITIDFTSNISMDEMESTLRSILMALSIRVGKQVNAHVVTINARNKEIIKLRLTDTASAAAGGCMPPLPRMLAGNSEFLATATQFFRNPEHKYVYWYLLTVWQSESAVLEVKEVCTGVAVEQVCSRFAEQHGAIDRTRSNEFMKARNEIAQAMENLPYDWQADHPKRIRAMIRGMNPVNTREKIMAVAKLLKLGVTEAQYKSWSNCRNGSAHYVKKRKKTDGRASDWLVCLTTLHRLVLAIIGWRGAFVDYSKSNYPSRPLYSRKIT
ncbi:MAG: hypothetical protein K2X77_09280 [Candidatus Obscuribacterales bacterium]|jgi:hypothetical protein|nr:hypothetical protein [Candidatus Obscuribacterales bacterium]